jgi:SH3-like domain-containing protein
MIPRLVLIVLAFSTIACYTSSALVEQQPTEQPTQPAVLPTDQALAVVTASEALNVRTGPAVTYPTTSFYLLAGWRVEIVSECVGGWVRIEYNDMTGWVNADYLSGSICDE